MPPLARLWRAGLPILGPWRTIAAALVALAGFALAAWLAVRLWPVFATGRLFLNDSTAQWSFARFAMERPAAWLYDGNALHAFQKRLYPPLAHTFPYPYPPHYLFAVWPLGWLDPHWVWPAWSGATLTLFLVSACAGTTWRTAPLLALAPLSITTIAYGQNGFLTSALLLGALRLLPRHQAASGVLLGLATIKPQLGLLIPVALLAAGQWRALASAAATIAALVLASSLAFGWDTWPRFLATLTTHAGGIDAWVGDHHKATIAAALAQAGAPRTLAYAVQWTVAAILAAVVWAAFRRGVTPSALALLIAAGFAATPYAFLYDLPMLTAAALLLSRDDSGRPRPLPWPEAAILAAALLFALPAVMTTRLHWAAAASLLALSALAGWRCLTRADAPSATPP